MNKFIKNQFLFTMKRYYSFWQEMQVRMNLARNIQDINSEGRVNSIHPTPLFRIGVSKSQNHLSLLQTECLCIPHPNSYVEIQSSMWGYQKVVPWGGDQIWTVVMRHQIPILVQCMKLNQSSRMGFLAFFLSCPSFLSLSQL